MFDIEWFFSLLIAVFGWAGVLIANVCGYDVRIECTKHTQGNSTSTLISG